MPLRCCGERGCVRGLHSISLTARCPSRRAPRELVLDVDATHVPLHGAQERGFFHGYYDNLCYLPL